MLLGYVVLAAVGTLGHQAWALRAAVPLLVLMLAQALPLRRAWGWVAWLALGAGLLWLDVRGQARAVLGALPVLINAGLCWVFTRTLRQGSEPLVTRVVRLVEGEDRLQIPGVAGYTRAVTVYWAVLTGVQVLALGGCWILLMQGNSASGPSWAHAWLHVGGYALPVLAMGIEYAWRRWRFRGQPHLPAHTFVRRLVACWPRILREPETGHVTHR
jgi:hypothetical protein